MLTESRKTAILNHLKVRFPIHNKAYIWFGEALDDPDAWNIITTAVTDEEAIVNLTKWYDMEL